MTVQLPVAALGPTLSVRPWVDKVVEDHPRSMFALSDEAELYWLPFVGPTALLCGRRLVAWLDESPAIVVGIEALGSMLGVRAGGKNSCLPRALDRLCRFNLARWQVGDSDVELLIRRTWGPLTERQVARLPAMLAALYRARP